MISLESDKMTALWPNDLLTLTFHETFSNCIQVFYSMISLESDEMTAVTKWQLNFHFLSEIYPWDISEISVRNAWEKPDRFLRYSYDKLEKFRIYYTWDTPEIRLRYVWDMPEIYLRFT